MRAEPLGVIAHRDPDWQSAREEEAHDPALLARLRRRLIELGFGLRELQSASPIPPARGRAFVCH